MASEQIHISQIKANGNSHVEQVVCPSRMVVVEDGMLDGCARLMILQENRDCVSCIIKSSIRSKHDFLSLF